MNGLHIWAALSCCNTTHQPVRGASSLRCAQEIIAVNSLNSAKQKGSTVSRDWTRWAAFRHSQQFMLVLIAANRTMQATLKIHNTHGYVSDKSSSLFSFFLTLSSPPTLCCPLLHFNPVAEFHSTSDQRPVTRCQVRLQLQLLTTT